MTTSVIEVDVAIVGCGPTGVVLAALLGQAGHRVWIGDRLPGVHVIPRAIALDHEILRVFQQIGVIDAVMPHVEPFTNSEFFGVDGQLIRRMTMVPPPHPQGCTPSVVFSQPPVERVLRDRVAALGNVTMALGVDVTGIEQDESLPVWNDEAHAVTLHLGDGSDVHARYAVGCDGGASMVRTRLGIGLDDLDFDEPWLVVDVLVNERGLAKLPKTSVQYCEPERPCTLVIGPKNHRRWEISLKRGEDPKEAETPARTWQHLARWLTPDDGTLWRQSSYRFHALVASRWREHRVFLAGDAAHMQPPFLGQGMCQGIRDAANLAWKLDHVLMRGGAGEASVRLLDSYGDERGAHVRELTTRIKGVGAVICERDVDKARARDAKLLADCGGVVRDTPRQDILPALTTGLLHASAGAGTLFPQPRLADDGSLMDLRISWHRACLVAIEGTLPAEVPADIDVVDIARVGERDGVVAAWMQRHGARVALVRPDHYVFGSAADTRGAAALVSAWQAALS